MKNFDYKKFFEGKKITKQGFGVLGRGYGVVKFLLECGAKVLVTDMKPESEFKEQMAEINKLIENLKKESEKKEGKYLGEVKYVFGEHRTEDFLNCDFVIQASGVPKDNFYLNFAKNNNVPIYQESSLFVKIVKENFENVKIIGITGTRGKTTTTFLIYEILKAKYGQEKVHLGGNVQGVATLELLKNVKENDFVVMELDSWILQGFGNIRISSDIAVFTTFMPDHMNYYKNNLIEYFLDKANIFEYQKPGQMLITSPQVVKYIKDFFGGTVVDMIVTDDKNDGDKYETKLIGKHNQQLIALAEKVSEELKIEKEIFLDVVKEFTGVKGRLEYVAEFAGIKIYNDTCATTGDATVAGLDAISETLSNNEKIILICGGRDKDLDMQNLINKFVELQNQDKLEIIFLSDETTTGTKKILDNLKAQKLDNIIKYTEVLDLGVAVAKAMELAKSGDKILFSPGFASFGMFKNEYDRGDKFVEVINSYGK